MSVAENERLALKFIAALGGEDLDQAFEHIAEDALVSTHTRLAPAGHYSKAAFHSLLRKLFHTLESVDHVDCRSIAAADDRVLLRTEWHMRMRGEVHRNVYYVLLRLREGKVSAFVSGPDMDHLKSRARAMDLDATFPHIPAGTLEP